MKIRLTFLGLIAVLFVSAQEEEAKEVISKFNNLLIEDKSEEAFSLMTSDAQAMMEKYGDRMKESMTKGASQVDSIHFVHRHGDECSVIGFHGRRPNQYILGMEGGEWRISFPGMSATFDDEGIIVVDEEVYCTGRGKPVLGSKSDRKYAYLDVDYAAFANFRNDEGKWNFEGFEPVTCSIYAGLEWNGFKEAKAAHESGDEINGKVVEGVIQWAVANEKDEEEFWMGGTTSEGKPFMIKIEN